MNKYIKLTICIILSILAGVIGSAFTTSAIPTWYAGLNKPFFNPPNWLFGPVWTILYILIGISLYLYWNSKPAPIGFIYWGVQMGLNALWSIIFFGLKMPFLAFIEILFLWAFILLTILAFWKKTRLGAYMMIPYLAWVSFASLLNLFIWLLN